LSFLCFLWVVCCGFTLVGRAASEIHMLTWSEYIDPEIPKQFEKETGIAVRIDVYEESEAMMAKLQAAGGASQYDLVVASDHVVPILAKLGLIGKLDLSQIPNCANVQEKFKRPPYDPKGEYSLPYQWGTIGIVYRKNLAGFRPSWGMLFDPKQQPGRVILLDSMRDTLGAALKFRGKSVNSRKKEDLQQAAALVLACKQSPKCLGFDGSPSAAKKVVSGLADLALVYNGDGLSAMKEDKSNSCDYVAPDEGSIVWVDTMVVTSQGPNRAGAHRFINYLLDGKVGAQLSNFVNYASPNAASMNAINEQSRKDVRIYPSEEQMKAMEYLEDIGRFTALYDEAWTAVKSR